MVISGNTRTIQSINDISTSEVLLSKMRSSVSGFLVFAKLVEWPMGFVARIALPQRATTGKSSILWRGLGRRWVAGSSGAALIQGTKGFRAMVVREALTARAGRIGRGGIFIPSGAPRTGLGIVRNRWTLGIRRSSRAAIWVGFYGAARVLWPDFDG